MEYCQLIKDIVKNKIFTINTVCPYYVKRLLPELDDRPCLVFHKTKVKEFTRAKKISAEENEQSDLDLTGSPLEYSFGKDSFSETVIQPKRYWLQDEENHLPIDVNSARSSINLCLESKSDYWRVSLLAVCNQEDKDKTVLLGTRIGRGYLRTILVRIREPKPISQVTDYKDFLKEHLEASGAKAHEVKVDVSCSYDLFGTKEIFTNWTDFPKSSFEGCLSFQFHWNTLSFYPPLQQSTKTLVMEIAAGWKESRLNHLWEDILLLNNFISILEQYVKKNLSSRYSVMPLEFPSNFINPNVKTDEEINDQLNGLFLGDVAFLENKNDNLEKPSTSGEAETELKLKQHLEDLHIRQNLDFTDYLWIILKGSDNYAQVTDCLHAVFQEVEKKDYKPQTNVANSTTLAKLLFTISQQKAPTPSLAGSFPLQLLVEIGLEKLNRDYTYLLLSSNLIDRHELQQKLSVNFNKEIDVEKFRTNLLILVQLHVCLEFTLLAETHVDFPPGNLQSLFSCAYNKFTSEESPIKSLASLEENCIYTLNAPIPNDIIKQLIGKPPSSWNVRFSSEVGILQMTTGAYYSLTPIFPPDIYNEDKTENQEESYYVVSILLPSYKIPKFIKKSR